MSSVAVHLKHCGDAPDRYFAPGYQGRKSGVLFDESKITKDVNGFETLDSFFASAYLPAQEYSEFDSYSYYEEDATEVKETPTKTLKDLGTSFVVKWVSEDELNQVEELELEEAVQESPPSLSEVSPLAASPSPSPLPVASSPDFDVAESPMMMQEDLVEEDPSPVPHKKKRVSFAVAPTTLLFDAVELEQEVARERAQDLASEREHEEEYIVDEEEEKMIEEEQQADEPMEMDGEALIAQMNMDMGMDMDASDDGNFNDSEMMPPPESPRYESENDEAELRGILRGSSPNTKNPKAKTGKAKNGKKAAKKGGQRRTQKPIMAKRSRRQSVYLSPSHGDGENSKEYFALGEKGATPPPASQIQMGPRGRPQRKRVQTLKYWKGERPVYGRRDSSGQMGLIKVVKFPSPAPMKRTRGGKKKSD